MNPSLRKNSNYPPMSDSDWADEIWKPCPDFENKYLVSNYGRVKSIGTYSSCKTGGIIVQHQKKGRNNYMQLRLYDNGRAKTVEVHTLVAKAFIPNPNHYNCINHIDEDKTNNKVSNLEWCTNQYNVRYSRAKAIDVYTLEGKLIDTLECAIDVAEKYNVPTTNICRSCNSKDYTEVHRKYQFRYKDEPFIPKPPIIIKPKKKKIHHGLFPKDHYYQKVNQYSLDGELIKTFSNLQEASNILGIARSNIRKSCKGKIVTAGGFIFLYSDNSNITIKDKLIDLANRKHISKTESKRLRR